jgi:putative transposase
LWLAKSGQSSLKGERVRLDRKATSIVLLVVLGVREGGQKVLLAVKNMGGETNEA